MSADAFQSEYASVMESMMKTAMAQTTKLVESMVNDLKAEISRVKSENELLRSVCGRQEGPRNQPVVQAGDTRPLPASRGEDSREVAEKHDRAVQCDLANMVRLPPPQQGVAKKTKYVLRPHKFITDEYGESKMTFTLVKHEHAEPVCVTTPMLVPMLMPASERDSQNLEQFMVEEKPTEELMLIQKVEQTTTSFSFEEETQRSPAPCHSPIISISTVMSITEEEFEGAGQPNFTLQNRAPGMTPQPPVPPEVSLASDHSYATKNTETHKKRPQRRSKSTWRPKKCRKPVPSKGRAVAQLRVHTRQGVTELYRIRHPLQQDTEDSSTEDSSSLTDVSSSAEDASLMTDDDPSKENFLLFLDELDDWDDPKPRVEAPVDLHSGIMLLATASEQQSQREGLLSQHGSTGTKEQEEEGKGGEKEERGGVEEMEQGEDEQLEKAGEQIEEEEQQQGGERDVEQEGRPGEERVERGEETGEERVERGEETGEERVEETGEERMEETGEETGEERVEETGEETGEERVEETGEERVEETGEERVEETGEERVERGEETGEERVERGEETGEERVERGEETGEERVERGEERVEETGEERVEETGEEQVEETEEMGEEREEERVEGSVEENEKEKVKENQGEEREEGQEGNLEDRRKEEEQGEEQQEEGGEELTEAVREEMEEQEHMVEEFPSSQEAPGTTPPPQIPCPPPQTQRFLRPVVRLQRLSCLTSVRTYKVSELVGRAAPADQHLGCTHPTPTKSSGNAPPSQTQMESSLCPVDIVEAPSSVPSTEGRKGEEALQLAPLPPSHPSDPPSKISQRQFLASLAVLPKHHRAPAKSSAKDGRSYLRSRMCKKKSSLQKTPAPTAAPRPLGLRDPSTEHTDDKDPPAPENGGQPEMLVSKEPMMVADPPFLCEPSPAPRKRPFGCPKKTRRGLEPVRSTAAPAPAKSAHSSPSCSNTSKSPGRGKRGGKVQSPERTTSGSAGEDGGLQSVGERSVCSGGQTETNKDQQSLCVSLKTDTPTNESPDKPPPAENEPKRSSPPPVGAATPTRCKSGASPRSAAAVIDGIRRFLIKKSNDCPSSPGASSEDLPPPPVKKVKLIPTLISSKKSSRSSGVGRFGKSAAKAKRRRQQQGRKIGTVKTQGVWIPPTFEESEVIRLQEEEEARREAESSFPGVDIMSLLVKKEPITSPLQPLTVIGKHLLRNQCGECGCKFSCSAALEKHVSLHRIYRPFSCKLCGKTYPDSRSFKRHDRVHRNGRIHVCSQCGKGFVYRFGLAKHVRMVHSRIKPFVCQVCNKGYATRQDIVAHTRMHTGEKPFICDFCEKRFTRRVQLNMHLRRHLGERRFWCSECDKGFMDLSNLKKHMLIHTGEKPHSCPHCNKRFTQAGHMRKHLRNVHCFE